MEAELAKVGQDIEVPVECTWQLDFVIMSFEGVGEEVIRCVGSHLVVELMRQGLSPEKACRKAVERIVNRDREKAKTLQVGFLALHKNGSYGGFAIQKGFSFAVKSSQEERLIEAGYLFA